MKKRMIATKAFRYGARRLMAGDVFDAVARDARLFEAIGRAQRYETREATAEVPPMPAEVAAALPDIDALRDKARSVGIEPDRRWSAATLERKIAEVPDGA